MKPLERARLRDATGQMASEGARKKERWAAWLILPKGVAGYTQIQQNYGQKYSKFSKTRPKSSKKGSKMVKNGPREPKRAKDEQKKTPGSRSVTSF